MSLKLWPVEPVRSVPVLSLVPAAAAISTDGPEAITAMSAKMLREGWPASVLIAEDGSILFGALHIMAAAGLAADGVERFNTCPVMIASGWDTEEIRAYSETHGGKAYLGSQLGIRTDLLGFSPDAFKRLFWDGLKRDETRAKAKPKSKASKRRPAAGKKPKRGTSKA